MINKNRAYNFFVKIASASTQRKRSILFSLFIFVFLFLSQNQVRAEFTYRPAIGLWFGPTAPLASTADSVDGYLGGGIFHRGNLPLQNFFYNFDISYLHFTSNLENRIHMFPFVGSLMYRPTFDLPVNFLFKAGLGMNYVSIKPERVHGWDPVALLGTEFYFPAGKIIRIGLRIDFLWTIERYIKGYERQVYEDGEYKTVSGAHRDGFTLNLGLSVYFNFVK